MNLAASTPLLACAVLLTTGALAQPAVQGPPAGYYSSVDASTPAALRTTLHAVIDDHLRFTYSGAWNILRDAQEDPNDPNNILDVYRNRSFSKFGSGFNREHSWPKSFGFPDDGPSNYPFTDCHMLFFSDDGYNTARSNRPFRDCNASCSEYTTDGGTNGTFAGESNWGSGNNAAGTWRVWNGRKGDIARAMFYADVRYEGDIHGTTGVDEPDLIITDVQSLITTSNTGQNEDTAYMGIRSVLLQWHLDDPVDAFEMTRNDVVASFQGNRNPFVDHPEWIDCLYTGNCSGGVAEIYCSPASGNSTGTWARIGYSGSLTTADNDLTLSVTQMPNNQFGYFLCGTARDFVFAPNGSQGNLCIGGEIGRFNEASEIGNSGVFGAFSVAIDLTTMPTNPNQPVLAGQTWTFQCWHRDFNPGSTSNFSEALEVTFD